MEKPKSTHLMTAKRILYYIKGSVIDFSTQGVMTFNSLVILTVIRQEMLTNERALRVMFSSWVIWHFLSNQRSKLLSLFLLVKQNMLLHYLEFVIQLVTEYKNKSVIALAKNLIFHEKSKHIDTRYYFICETIKENKVNLISVKTQDQLVDIFTMPLKHEIFSVIRSQFVMITLGLRGNIEN